MGIQWNYAHLVGRSWGLTGNAQDVSNLVKTIVNEYELQSKNSQKIVYNAVRKYATNNDMTELDVYNCLEKANKKFNSDRDT